MKLSYQRKKFCFKAIPTVCLLSGAIALAPAVHAADLPCEIVLSRTQLEIGRVSPIEVNPRHLTQGQISLGKQTSTLNVICTEPARFAVVFRAAANSEKNYRLSDAEDPTSLNISMTQAQVDGQPGTFASTLDAGRNGPRMSLSPGDGARPQIGGQNIAVSRFSAVVEIEAFLDAARMKSPSDRALNGSGFFEVVPY